MKTNSDIKLGVSLYSYQDNYYFHKHDLEGCLAAAAGAGATGIEIFPEAMIPEWPYISDSFIDRYNGMMERYGLETVCVDHFADRAMHKNKLLTDDELLERSIWYIKAANKLGATHIRLMHSAHLGRLLSMPGHEPIDLVGPELAGRLLPYCQEYGIVMALECHSPTSVDDPVQQAYLEVADKMGLSEYIGLQVDFSSYEYCISTADVGMYSRQGVNRDFLELIREKQREAYFSGKEFVFEEVEPELRKIGFTDEDKNSLRFVLRHRAPASYEKLKEFASQVVYVHGKFYDIDEDGQVDNMDYPKIFKALIDGGYKGYICSEFEGNRRMNDAGWCDEIEYVRKHHVLMRKCLEMYK
ncbi:MAG: TIM barrel protein [Clostridiales bacterium]|nr:TIM barrel protein [Clostridiales bacterium]